MKISRILIRNFKRFSNLVIQGIPREAKLVLLVGPNGAGKSCLFDALIQWYRSHVGFGRDNDLIYFRKEVTNPFDWNRTVDVSFHDNVPLTKKAFYFRSAYRNDPDFHVSSFSRSVPPYDDLRIPRIINDDKTVSQNYTRLIYTTVEGVYSQLNDEKKVSELREELIGAIRKSMLNVFGDLILNNISDPLTEGSFFFKKGQIKSFHYKNLSGGEKAGFDLLLDLLVKAKHYDDTVFCIDEPELHMHTRLQAKLVREMVNIIPENSQLWLATHSLGVMRAAKDLQDTNPGIVCILDFDGCNFDEECLLIPSTINRVVWDKFLSVTLDDLSTQFVPKLVIVCEGSSTGIRRKDFDAEIYSRIFRTEPDLMFVSGGSSNQIGSEIMATLLKGVLKGSKIINLLDRDDRSASEIAESEKRNIICTRRRNLESYLFDDEVLETLLRRENKQNLKGDVHTLTQKAIEDSKKRGNAPDDLKSAAGDIYVGLKKLLELTSCGSNSDAFMRDTLASLIVPGMNIYNEMKTDIVQKARNM